MRRPVNHPQQPPPQNSSLPPLHLFSVEWGLVKYLEGWEPDSIRYAIRNNVDLVQLLREYGQSAGWLVRLARGHAEPLGAYLDPVHVLLWFSVRLPRLHEAIVTEPGGEAWIRENFQRLKTYLQI